VVEAVSIWISFCSRISKIVEFLPRAPVVALSTALWQSIYHAHFRVYSLIGPLRKIRYIASSVQLTHQRFKPNRDHCGRRASSEWRKDLPPPTCRSRFAIGLNMCFLPRTIPVPFVPASLIQTDSKFAGADESLGFQIHPCVQHARYTLLWFCCVVQGRDPAQSRETRVGGDPPREFSCLAQKDRGCPINSCK
jgi:hypothetical protein